MTVSTGWKIFSTVFKNSRYYQHANSDVSTVVGVANNRPCCAPEGLVRPRARRLTELAGQKLSRQLDSQRESEQIPGSPCLWTYVDGPGRKTGDIPPDRTETRPEGPAEPRRLTPFGRIYTRGRRPGRFSEEPEIFTAQVTDRSQSESAAAVGNRFSSMRYNNCVS